MMMENKEMMTSTNSSTPNNEEKILEVKDLRISFRTNNGNVKAVRGINFSLYRGRTLGIVGESGSGKSVTSRAILGILAGNKIVEGGQILYDGKDLLSLREEDFTKIRGSKISMIFQDPLSSLNPVMRVGKQLTEAIVLKAKATRKEAQKTLLLFAKLIEKHASEAGLYTKKEIQHLLKRYRESSLSLIDHLHPNDYDMANELFTICLNQPYSRDVEITADKEKIFLECLLPSVGELAAKAENKKDKKAVREWQSARKRHVKVVLSMKANYIHPEWALLEEEKEAILKCLSVAVEKEYQSAKEGKEKVLDYVKNLLNTVFVDASSYDINALKSSLKELKKLILSSQYVFAEIKDDIALTLIPTLEGYIADYKTSLHLLEEQRKEQEKKEKMLQEGKKYDDIRARAYGREVIVSPEEVITKTKEIIVSFIAHYEQVLNEEFDNATYTNTLFEYIYRCYKNAVHEMSKREIKDKAIELLGEVGIPEPEKRFSQYPFQFSGGMRQRIVIAIALSSNPDILICDEPTTALDVTIQSQILELINRLKVEKGLSIIFITHDLGVIANMADDIAVMYAGKIVEYGTVEDIFYDPKHPYTWALLSSMPDLNTKEKLEAIPGTPPNMILPPKGDAFAARNKYAMKIDFEKEPPLFKVSDTHYAATWLLHPNAPKVEAPKIVTERIRIAKARKNGEEMPVEEGKVEEKAKTTDKKAKKSTTKKTTTKKSTTKKETTKKETKSTTRKKKAE